MQGSGFLVYLNCRTAFGRMNLERLGNLVRLGKFHIALTLNTISLNFEF